MKIKYFSFLMMFFFYSSYGYANDCRTSNLSLKVSPIFHGYTVERSASPSRLERLRDAPADKGMHILGLTVGGLSYEMSLSIAVTSEGNRNSYGCVQDLNVNYGTAERIKVYIIPTLKEGSCEYKTTMEHELLHVSFLEEAVRTGAPLIKRALERELRNKPFTGRNSGEVTEKAKKFVGDIIQGEFNKISAKLDRQNAAIDTKESYAKTAAICDNRRRR